MSDEEDKMLDKIRQLVREDSRWPFEAYIFVYQALEFTTRQVVKERRHVKGPELLEGIRRFAVEAFGPLALMVLTHWGLRRTSDFGEIVWNLVTHDLMGKTEEDKREDFADIYSFDEVFAPETLLRQVNMRELAPPARVSFRELPRACRAKGSHGA